jgi:hypothetical protein
VQADFLFQIVHLVDEDLLLLLLLVFVLVDPRLEGQFRLGEPGQGFWIFSHVAVETMAKVSNLA